MCDRYFAMVCRCHWLTMTLYETVSQSTVIGSAVYLLNLNAACLCQYLRHRMNMYLPYWIIYTMSLYHVLMVVSVYFYCYRCYAYGWHTDTVLNHWILRIKFWLSLVLYCVHQRRVHWVMIKILTVFNSWCIRLCICLARWCKKTVNATEDLCCFDVSWVIVCV